jgi:hypothetical protein
MFHEVGDASDTRSFVSGTHRGPESDCHGLRRGHRAGGDPKAVTEYGDA